MLHDSFVFLELTSTKQSGFELLLLVTRSP